MLTLLLGALCMFNIDVVLVTNIEDLLPSPEPTSVFVLANDFEEKLFPPLIQASEHKILDADLSVSISQLQNEVGELKKMIAFQEYRMQNALIHVCTCASLMFSLTLVALCMYSCKKKPSMPRIINVDPLRTETIKV